MSAGISIPIGGDLTPFLKAIAELREDFDKMSASSEHTFRAVAESGKHAAKGIKEAFAHLSENLGLGEMFGPMLKFMTIKGAITGFIDGVKETVESASDFEDLVVEMEQFTGSAEKARDVMAELSAFTKNTPFSGKPIREAAVGLLQSGVPSEDVVGLTQDITSVSKNPEQIAEFSGLMGKAFSKGTVKLKELNGFLTNHVNILSAIGEQLGTNQAATLAAVQAGVGFEVVSKALHSMSQEGGQFFELMTRKGATYSGMMQKLANVWGGVKRSFVQPMLEGMSPFLALMVEKIGTLKQVAVTAGAAIKDAMFGAFVLIKEGHLGEVLGAGLHFAVAGAIDKLMQGMTMVLAFLTTALPPVLHAAIAIFSDPHFWDALGNACRGLGLIVAAEIQKAIPGMADAVNHAGDAMEGALRKLVVASHFFLPEENEQILKFTPRAERGKGEATDMSSLYLDLAKIQMQFVKSGDVVKAGAQGLADGLLLAGDVGKNWQESPSVREAKAKIEGLMKSVADKIEDLKQASEVPEPPGGKPHRPDGLPDDSTPPADDKKSASATSHVLTTALGKIGGGGFGMTFLPMLSLAQQGVSEQKKTNSLLERVAKSIHSAPVIA